MPYTIYTIDPTETKAPSSWKLRLLTALLAANAAIGALFLIRSVSSDARTALENTGLNQGTQAAFTAAAAALFGATIAPLINCCTTEKEPESTYIPIP